MKTPSSWQGADAVFFDCDSTLSHLEGVDELAAMRGVDVAALTVAAMSGDIPLEDVFGERLRLIQPSAEDLHALSQRYQETVVEGAAEGIVALRSLGIRVGVISGGLLPAVLPFAEALGVDPAEVHAVPWPLGQGTGAGDPLAVACAHPLARAGGKPEVLRAICRETAGQTTLSPQRCMLVGDGASDLEAAPEIGLFVGFGGVIERPIVKQEATVFLPGPGLWQVVGLAAGRDRLEALREVAPQVYEYAVSWFSPPPD